MPKLVCGDCGNEYTIENMSDEPVCPDCGFGPSECDHPLDSRGTDSIYSLDEGKYVERTICQKCGTPVN
jgi:hypothetical protein